MATATESVPQVTATESAPLVTGATTSLKQGRSPAQLEALARARQKAIEVRKQLAMDRRHPPVTEAPEVPEASPAPAPEPKPAPEDEVDKEEEVEYVKAARKQKKPPKKRIIVVQESESSSEEEIEVRMPRKKPYRSRAHREPDADERLLKSYNQLFSM
mmetsp:Transcript_7175/g.10944  ORF Transcript_7175/g.10944 Transcript_7175/m.10944 type:complete len:159 (-) Transcript_7175:23-499(-)